MHRPPPTLPPRPCRCPPPPPSLPCSRPASWPPLSWHFAWVTVTRCRDARLIGASGYVISRGPDRLTLQTTGKGEGEGEGGRLVHVPLRGSWLAVPWPDRHVPVADGCRGVGFARQSPPAPASTLTSASASSSLPLSSDSPCLWVPSSRVLLEVSGDLLARPAVASVSRLEAALLSVTIRPV